MPSEHIGEKSIERLKDEEKKKELQLLLTMDVAHRNTRRKKNTEKF